jgi:hypothetical protein
LLVFRPPQGLPRILVPAGVGAAAVAVSASARPRRIARSAVCKRLVNDLTPRLPRGLAGRPDPSTCRTPPQSSTPPLGPGRPARIRRRARGTCTTPYAAPAARRWCGGDPASFAPSTPRRRARGSVGETPTPLVQPCRLDPHPCRDEDAGCPWAPREPEAAPTLQTAALPLGAPGSRRARPRARCAVCVPSRCYELRATRAAAAVRLYQTFS